MTPNIRPIGQIFNFLITIIDHVLVPLIFGVALIVFTWGVYNYFIAGGANEEKRKEGRNFIIYGIVGFFIMVSLWGLVNVLVYSFGFNRATRPPIPTFNESTGDRSNPFGESEETTGGGGSDTTGGGDAGGDELDPGDCDPITGMCET